MTAAQMSTRDLLLEFEAVGTSMRRLHPTVSDCAILQEMRLRVDAGAVPLEPWLVFNSSGERMGKYSCMRAAESVCQAGWSIRLESEAA